ncbi:MAG: aminotransferase [Alcaligenaceae bacterium]|nr:aminotransferase [Alcaligenaceae bacterium]
MTPAAHQTAAAGQPGASAPAAPPSLIETMRLEPGATLPLLAGHLERLQRSSAALGYPCPRQEEIRQRIQQTAANLDAGRWWRLRLLLSADGGLSLETAPLAPPLPPLQVVVQGPRMSGAPDWLLHKTTHRPWYKEAEQWLAARPDIFDVLYWNEAGDMCEGSRSNLYMQTADGSWLTPPLASGALPGVQRQALLQAGRVKEAVISRDTFLQAPAIRISNALRGWCDAVVKT